MEYGAAGQIGGVCEAYDMVQANIAIVDQARVERGCAIVLR